MYRGNKNVFGKSKQMCYDNKEVKNMDQEKETLEVQEEYKPRPKWQVWLARVGLVVFLITVIVFYIHLFRGV
jgi:hypothetical protein